MALPDLAKIHAVDTVTTLITRTEPPWLIIHAIGRAPTTGWSGGRLSKYVYLTPPDDGTQDFDFIAERPTADIPVLNVLTPISAHAEIPDIDVENYWGQGQALRGIRISAVSNAKTLVLPRAPTAADLADRAPPQAKARYVSPIGGDEVPGYEEEIKPLFRPRDVSEMILWGGFNLHKYEDVITHAENIHERLGRDMPCDGLWPVEDRELFARWKDGGMPA